MGVWGLPFYQVMALLLTRPRRSGRETAFRGELLCGAVVPWARLDGVRPRRDAKAKPSAGREFRDDPLPPIYKVPYRYLTQAPAKP